MHQAIASVPAPLDETRQRLIRVLARLARAQAAAIAARTLLLAAAVALALAAALVLADVLLVLDPRTRALLRWTVPLAFAVVTVRRLRAHSAALGRERIALLIEEQHPQLQHLLPTLLTARGDSRLAATLARRAHAALDDIPAHGLVRWRLRDVSLRALAAAVVFALALLLAPGAPTEALDRWLHPEAAAAWSGPGPAGIGGSPPDATAPRFERVTLHVTPPGYTGLRDYEVSADDPVTLISGSVVRVRGRLPQDADSLHARITGGTALDVRLDAARWTAAWTFTSAHTGVILEAVADGAVRARRVVPLLLRPDRPPAVELLEPDRDLVLARPQGTVTVAARATDDFGIEQFDLAWVRSRGSGESFQYEEFVSQWTRTGGSDRARTGALTLDLATLGLQPGDALHLRAVARDAPGAAAHAAAAHPDAGGTGVSPTRVVRIARADETDAVNTTIGFPLEGEEAPVLSQRMIIVLTERLIARAPSLDAAAVRREAGEIAHHQERLRQRVGDQIYIRATGGVQDADLEFGFEDTGGAHEHAEERAEPRADTALTPGERAERERVLLEAAARATGSGNPEELAHVHDASAIIAVNRPLMETYNAMWAAERELRLFQPRAALPHEERALELLQRLRQGERVYSRAPQRAPPVDVQAARGTGTLVDAVPAARSPSAPANTTAHLVARLNDASARLDAQDASAAALALSALAAELLAGDTAAREAGALLARAADRAARGDRRGADEFTAAARRVLDPPGAAATGAPMVPAPRSSAGADYLRRRAQHNAAQPAARVTAPPPGAPFTFVTLRYESGNWDSAPLVPTNVAHAIAQYTDIAVAPEGRVVDLASDELFRHPSVFMTGHLPVRFTDAEARNLRAYVERGGFVFIDDHSHDIDGAFHRTVTAELARIFGPGSLRPLPSDHELYRTFFVFEDGPPNTPHELNGWGDGLVHEHLFAIMSGGRIGVLYSNKDYASEWNYHYPNKRFLGLDNTRFAVNIITYALTR